MDNESNKSTKSECGAIHGLVKDIHQQWPENLTILDLSNSQIETFEETVLFPSKLTNLNLSHNILRDVPSPVQNLENIKCLDLSHNKIQYFDDTPKFCHSIEKLNLSHNQLLGPPYWVWAETAPKLVLLDISSNYNLTQSLTDDEYVAELFQFKPLVKEVKISNCKIRNVLEILSTLSKAKVLELGSSVLNMIWRNRLSSIPCEGLDQCFEVEKLILSNTHIYSIEPTIDRYKCLKELDLTNNNIRGVPNQFCNLENLEVCILSFNNVMYLPDEMVRLKNLTCLRLNSNELCMLPENLCKLPNLKILDLYENNLYEVADEVKNIEELDLAQNFMEEPTDYQYLEKKEKIRLNIHDRKDGRKPEIIIPEYDDHSPDITDDEDYIKQIDCCTLEEQGNNDQVRVSSPEDWDSDEYWVPHPNPRAAANSKMRWLHFVKQKMDEGNFCPMDMHTVSVAEQVKYEKMCYPRKWEVKDGQFDDLSGDDT